MAFGYSPLIQLYDIVNNTEPLTWGDLTDANLARLEQACHGVVTISATTTGDYVLNDTSGSGTESHKKVLVITGTQVANLNIIVPLRQRAYDVVNHAAVQGGNWTVTIKTATQVSPIGVVLNSGDHARVYCSGAAVHLIFSTAEYLPRDGSAAMTAAINMGGFKVTNAAAATAGSDLVTKTQLDAATAAAGILPVGSLYFNAGVATNPATLLGYGTWTAFGEGRVLIGVGSTTDSRGESRSFSLGDTGGEYRHVQTVNEMAPHSHSGAPSQPAGQGGGSAWYNRDGNTGSAGGGLPANVTQPYIAVHIWRRTA